MNKNISVLTQYAKNHKTEISSIRKAIEKYDRIVVFRHIKPDYDALGSQLGLVTFLKDNFPDKEIHFVGDNHVSFTPRLFPVMERLNDNWFTKPFLAIVLDVGDHERIADPRYLKADYICKIDHHPAKKEIANSSLLDIDSAAAAELVTIFLLTWKEKTISALAARYLYIGIVGDSGRFQYSSTSEKTFVCAASLLKTGININDIYLSMYEKKIDDLKVTAYILNHFNVTPHGVAYYVLPSKIQEELGIVTEQGKDNVNLFSNIQGINAWCSVSEDPNPKDYCWRISIRSKGEDISPIAVKYHGGGHAQASGAKIASLDELNSFLNDLDGLFA